MAVTGQFCTPRQAARELGISLDRVAEPIMRKIDNVFS
jgi:hypothetical protein